MQTLTLIAALIGSVACLSTPPEGALVVSKTPHQHEYGSISLAVAALSKTTTSEQVIFIKAGLYNEQVLIEKLAGPLTIYGESTDPQHYASNTVIVQAAENLDTQEHDDATGTVRVHTDDFKMYNINIKNTKGKGIQAIALSAYGNQGYYACQMLGYQDTLLAERGKQLYHKCYIQGATDFIFGQEGQCWFDDCVIGVVTPTKYGYITASGRSSANSPSYYVINKSKVRAADSTVPEQSFYLGRPWAEYARVAFQYTDLPSVVNANGWSSWEGGPSNEHVEFGEWENTGRGSKGKREIGKTLPDGPVPIEKVLGSDYKSAKWVDPSFQS